MPWSTTPLGARTPWTVSASAAGAAVVRRPAGGLSTCTDGPWAYLGSETVTSTGDPGWGASTSTGATRLAP